MLVTRQYDEIYKKIYQDVLNNTPITNMNPGSTARAIIDAISSRFAELYNSMDVYNRAAYLSTATGPYLDYLGELMGVTRYQSMRAYSGTSNFHFYIDPKIGKSAYDLRTIVLNNSGVSMSSIVILAGTTVSQPNTDGVSYTTTENAVLVDGTTGVYVPVVATGTGSDYNVHSNTLVRHNISSNQWELYSIADYILCTNDNDISTGMSIETDANYRQRIMDARYSNVSGNMIAIRNAALSVPGVVDVIINQYAQGIGTYEMIIISAYPIIDDHILAAVNASVSAVSAAGMRFIITTPEYMAIELKLKIHYQPYVSEEGKNTIVNGAGGIRSSIIDYTNNLGVGGEWVVNEVIQRVMQVSDGIKDIEPLRFRVRRYMRPRTVLSSGKVEGEADSIPYTGEVGASMIWTNQRCKMSNPSQMFLMLPNDLVIC